MAVRDCLKKMGFSRQESAIILEDIGDGKAADVVREHIRMLEDEHAEILRQASIEEGPRPIVDTRDMSMEIVREDGTVTSAQNALAEVDAEIAQAQVDSQGYEAAAACALRG